MPPDLLHKKLIAWWNTKSIIWKEVKKYNWGLLKGENAVLTPTVTFSFSQLQQWMRVIGVLDSLRHFTYLPVLDFRSQTFKMHFACIKMFIHLNTMLF